MLLPQTSVSTSAPSRFLWSPGDPPPRVDLGGKATALRVLATADVSVPSWFVVTPAAFHASLSLGEQIGRAHV